MRGSLNDLNAKASGQALPIGLSNELVVLLVWSTHGIDKARDIALGYLKILITSFPSLTYNPSVVFAILGVRTLLRKACEDERYDEMRVMPSTLMIWELLADPCFGFTESSLTQLTSSIRNGWVSR